MLVKSTTDVFNNIHLGAKLCKALVFLSSSYIHERREKLEHYATHNVKLFCYCYINTKEKIKKLDRSTTGEALF